MAGSGKVGLSRDDDDDDDDDGLSRDDAHCRTMWTVGVKQMRCIRSASLVGDTTVSNALDSLQEPQLLAFLTKKFILRLMDTLFGHLYRLCMVFFPSAVGRFIFPKLKDFPIF